MADVAPPASRGTNITPILEHILGLGEIKTPEDLQIVIKALREMGDKPLFSSEAMAELMERIQNHKGGADKAVAE